MRYISVQYMIQPRLQLLRLIALKQTIHKLKHIVNIAIFIVVFYLFQKTLIPLKLN